MKDQDLHPLRHEDYIAVANENLMLKQKMFRNHIKEQENNRPKTHFFKRLSWVSWVSRNLGTIVLFGGIASFISFVSYGLYKEHQAYRHGPDCISVAKLASHDNPWDKWHLFKEYLKDSVIFGSSKLIPDQVFNTKEEAQVFLNQYNLKECN